MKKVFKALSISLFLVLTVLSLVGCKKNKSDTILIGSSGPLTGGAASYGIAVKNSAELAVEEINANGGLNGTKFSFEILDDELLATKAATNYTTLFEKGMQISLGAVTSGACLEFGSYAKDDNLFCLTPSATNDGVPAIGVYQMCFSDSGQGTAAAKYIEANYPDAKVGIFYDASDDYSKGIYDNFKQTYKGETVSASFTSATKTDFAGQVETLKGCDFIFMPIYYSEAALFIEQSHEKLASDAVFFGCDGFDGIQGVENFDPFKYTQEISYLSHFDNASSDEKVKNYIKNYTEKYGNETLNQFGAAAYDCVYAIYEALKNEDVNAETTAKEFFDILSAKFSSGFTFSGVTGTNIKWNADYTVNKQPTKYVVNKNN